MLQTKAAAESSRVYANSLPLSDLLKQTIFSMQKVASKYALFLPPAVKDRTPHGRPAATKIFCLSPDHSVEGCSQDWSGLTFQHEGPETQLPSFTECNQSIFAQDTALKTPSRHFPVPLAVGHYDKAPPTPVLSVNRGQQPGFSPVL